MLNTHNININVKQAHGSTYYPLIQRYTPVLPYILMLSYAGIFVVAQAKGIPIQVNWM